MLRGWLSVGLLCVVSCGGKSSVPGSGDAPSGGAGSGATGPSSAGRASESDASAGATASSGGSSGGASRAGSSSGGRSSAGGGTSKAGASTGGTSQGGDAGSAAGETSCTPGEVRCETVRERCDDTGSWQKESFVCAVDLTGAQESALVCAVKSDGRMTCFGPSSYDPDSPLLIANAPAASWSRLFIADDMATVSDHQLCGIDQSGAGTCWGTGLQGRSIGNPKLVANGSDGLCVVGQAGDWSCPENLSIAGQLESGTDRVLDLQMRSGQLFGLKVDGTVLMPYPGDMLPGVYTRISASTNALCALREDHTAVCASHGMPIPIDSQRFLDLAVDYWGNVCGIREDQTIVCEHLGTASFDTVPPEGKFTRLIVMEWSTICGIRVDGSIACAGEAGLEPPADW